MSGIIGAERGSTRWEDEVRDPADAAAETPVRAGDPMSALQLDLFGEIEQAETDALIAACDRRRDALTCLIDAYPYTLEMVLGDRRPDRGEVKQGTTGDWAYSRRAEGFWFEDRAVWGATPGAWTRRPARLLTWAELDDLTAADPRIEQVRTWADSLTAIDAWRDRSRPHELWPHPETWHPSYIKGDHNRPGWAERLHAWTLLLDTLRDAREAIR